MTRINYCVLEFEDADIDNTSQFRLTSNNEIILQDGDLFENYLSRNNIKFSKLITQDYDQVYIIKNSNDSFSGFVYLITGVEKIYQ